MLSRALKRRCVRRAQQREAACERAVAAWSLRQRGLKLEEAGCWGEHDTVTESALACAAGSTLRAARAEASKGVQGQTKSSSRAVHGESKGSLSRGERGARAMDRIPPSSPIRHASPVAKGSRAHPRWPNAWAPPRGPTPMCSLCLNSAAGVQ